MRIYIQHYSFKRARESVEKWEIGLILKNVKSHFDDDIWVHINLSLEFVMPWTQDICQNKLSIIKFHSLVIVLLYKLINIIFHNKFQILY